MCGRMSGGQSVSGGMASPEGAPSRTTPTRQRLRRSTMALVQCVVPSMAWRMAPAGIFPSLSTPSTASVMPEETSVVVGRLHWAMTSSRSSRMTASVLVPPTSIPSRYCI
jgi:hypothetical protein